MKCRHCQRLFSRHLDDRLSDGERQTLEAHLSGCARCRAELARWELPSRALRAMRPAEVPEGLAERAWRSTLAAASRTPASFEERFLWAARRAAVGSALAAALVWGGVLWGDPGREAAADVAPLDAAEMAMSLWSSEPAGDLSEAAFEATPEGEVFDGK